MKHVFLLIVCFLTQNAYGKEIWKIFSFHEKSLLITDDFEMWELNWLQKNKPTWGEWFYSTEISQPEYGFYDAESWQEGVAISMHFSPWKSSALRKNYRNGEENLLFCNFLIEAENEALVFARELSFDDFCASYCLFIDTILGKKTCYYSSFDLLEQKITFHAFLDTIFEEKRKKNENLVFDKRYVAFDEHYDFYKECVRILEEKVNEAL